MAELVRRAAAVSGEQWAVVDDHSPRQSWTALDERVNRWVHLLRARGLGTGDRVAVFAGNRREVVEAVLGCLHAGVTFVPVNWHLTAGEVAYLLTDSQCRGLVVDRARAATAAAALSSAAIRPDLCVVTGGPDGLEGFEGLEALLDAQPGDEPAQQCSGATMLYTSGTTGNPKGVVNGLLVAGAPLSRVDVLVQRLQAGLGVDRGGRALLAGPWYHSAQLFFSLFPLLGGCRLVIHDGFDPARVLTAIDEHGITSSHLVPTQFIRLLRLPAEARAAFRGATLRRVWHGGGPCAIDVKRQMIEWWGPVLTEYYAATEGGIATVIDSAGWLSRPGSVGRAAPPNELVVAGADGTPLPAFAEGTVYLRRPADNDFHYHGAPEKTRDAHLAPGTFTYGDTGYLDDDGYLFLTGRRADTIVSGGVNVYPAEVEAVLQTHPAVRDAAVFGIADDEFGERVTAAVAVAPDAPAATALFEQLDRHCRARLAGFKVPRQYRVVGSVPREPTGKLRRQVLRDRLAAPDPLLADPATYATGVPHDEFRRRRAESPVAWAGEPPLRRHRGGTGTHTRTGAGFWAVTGHAAVVAASRDTATFSSAAGGAFLADPQTPEQLERARQLLANMDAPEHTRLRRLVSTAFGPRSVRALRRSIRQNAAEVADAVLAAGEFDAVADLAAELPLIVLADLFGMPRADRGLLLRWSNHLVGFDDPRFGGGDVAVYRDTFAEASDYVRRLAAHRRAHPAEDVVSLLANAEVDGRRLTDQELCQFWMLLVVAGNETTRHAISGGLLALTEHHRQRDRLVADPALLPTATEEILRWVTPIMQFRRTATADTELAGQPIAAGDKVVLYYISANRDEAVFERPDDFDVGRQPNPHLAFGVGAHFCLGAALAREELSTMLEFLRPHLSRLELTAAPTRLQSNFMNGLTAMPVRFTPERPR
ncbi:cytochrome P450 [Dactylosporangium sp. NPDC000244]|uniref:cytochrome P450 n=1 Tax=Dactylosporangium sp. NPDC000244 TaxID=3154365 RepID=UPI003329BF5D